MYIKRAARAARSLVAAPRMISQSRWTSISSGADSAPARPPLIYPEPPTTNHNSLSSFLAYAERTGLAPQSTTYVGTHFEYTVLNALARYGLSLHRVGGQSDHGIDLLGTWRVPSSPDPLRVLVQCKALAKASGPNLIRELEGAFVGAPVGWKGSGVLGLFVTEKPATKGVREGLGRSKWPMGFISCDRKGRVQQWLWNRRAQEEGLEGLGVVVRHAADGLGQTLMLTWKGQHLPLSRPTNDEKIMTGSEAPMAAS